VSPILRQIKQLYGQIEATRGKAQYLASNAPSSGSMFAGLTADEMGKSFLSDIKNFFGSISYKGAIGNSQMQAQI
jgi:hypothetical protein